MVIRCECNDVKYFYRSKLSRLVVVLLMVFVSLMYGVNGLNVFSSKSFHMIESFWRKFNIVQENPLNLTVENISVHRISYLDTSTNKIDDDSNQSDQITSVVVTWEEHELAHQVNQLKATSSTKTNDFLTDTDMIYELQMWVNGWGLDSLWHQSNRKLLTTDPFAVLTDLPIDHEMSFRVRLKMTQRTGFLSGLFATETYGPWSQIVTVSPVRDDAFDAVLVFLYANKGFSLVMATCIGSSVLLLLRLLIFHSGHIGHIKSSDDKSLQKRGKFSIQDTQRTVELQEKIEALNQEMKNLKQELLDSENEVRKLMLLRGYGIDELDEEELLQLENELKQIFQRIQLQRRKRKTQTNTIIEE